MIVALVGIDGAGKSTAGQLLPEQLTAGGYPAVLTSNRSGRRSVGAWRDRHRVHPPIVVIDAVETIIRSFNVLVSHGRARDTSRVVVMDRYLYCQLALRRARGLPDGWLLPLLVRTLPAPTLVFYFDVPVATAQSRIARRATYSETLAHLGDLVCAYEGLPQFESFVILDASRSPEDLVEDMLQELGVCGMGLP